MNSDHRLCYKLIHGMAGIGRVEWTRKEPEHLFLFLTISTQCFSWFGTKIAILISSNCQKKNQMHPSPAQMYQYQNLYYFTESLQQLRKKTFYFLKIMG